jgi:hypothetical protein
MKSMRWKDRLASPQVIMLSSFLLIFIVIGFFIFYIFPGFESTTVAGFIGVLIGSLTTFLSSVLASVVGLWKVSRESDERLKDRISNHALELTRLDYELRQKSLELTKRSQQFLAPAKVYRTFYKALYDLHTTGNWPSDVQDLGLLNIFELSYGDTYDPVMRKRL